MRQKERTTLIQLIDDCLESAKQGGIKLTLLRLQVIRSYLIQKGKGKSKR